MTSRPYLQTGLTLIELLVGLAIASILLAVIYLFFGHLSRSYTAENAKTQAQQGSRAAIDMIAREIRLAGYDPNNTGLFGIELATSDQIQFTMDRNENGELDKTRDEEVIRIEQDPVTHQIFRRIYPGMPRVYSYAFFDEDEVIDLDLQYIDQNGIVMTTPVAVYPADSPNTKDIRLVRITLTIKESSGRRQHIVRTYTTQVLCRNLGSYLKGAFQ